MSSKNLTEEEQLWGRFYSLLHQIAEDLRKKDLQHLPEEIQEEQEQITREEACKNLSYEERTRLYKEKWLSGEWKFLSKFEMDMYVLPAFEKERAERKRRSENVMYNDKHHGFLLERIEQFKHLLTKEEDDYISKMLVEQKWGEEEVNQIRQFIENAVWSNTIEKKIKEVNEKAA